MTRDEAPRTRIWWRRPVRRALRSGRFTGRAAGRRKVIRPVRRASRPPPSGAPDECQGGQSAPASEFVRAPEDVVVIYELGLVGLYAGLSKLFRRHKVVSLVEGDYRHIGRTGSAASRSPSAGSRRGSSTCSWPTTRPRGTTWSGRSTSPSTRSSSAGGWPACRPTWSRGPPCARRPATGRRCSSPPAASSPQRGSTC